ncbi:MAG: ADP-ribosylglycohydrolase family protein [Mesorhizobium sp.]
MARREKAALIDRAMGALVGGALGDALGMPTQLLTAEEIRNTYGPVEGFVTPVPDHPVSKGLPAGSITDDTEQTLLLAEVLINSASSFDQKRWVASLIEWERGVKARGGYDLLGPSTKRAIDLINAGADPVEAGRGGSTNGAAMRIGPVGIALKPEPLILLVERVQETTAATHGSSVAISSASAVAAAVSCGVEGGDWRSASNLGVEAARLAQGTAPSIDMAGLIEKARNTVRGQSGRHAIELVVSEVGTGVESEQSIPAAFAILEVANGDPWKAAVLSANLGGDTDTIGAIAAGMAGACIGYSHLPEKQIAQLKGLDLANVRLLAERLVDLRLGV